MQKKTETDGREASRDPNIRAEKRIAKTVNAVSVSCGEMVEFVMECQKLQGDARCYEGHVITAMQLHPEDQEKRIALLFRVESLAELIHEEGTPGWTLPPLADGRVLTQQAVFAAAAVEPLIVRNGELRFSRASFLKKVLELAEAEDGIQ